LDLRAFTAQVAERGVSDVLAPALVDFDTGQDLPEIQEAEKLLKHKHYASQPFS
jgi:hypothetical protein